jgi:hypothetical protein
MAAGDSRRRHAMTIIAAMLGNRDLGGRDQDGADLLTAFFGGPQQT